MSLRWYESRTNQAALIGGLFVFLAAIAAGLFPHFGRDSYPPVEIKNLTPTGEEVLARLALTPSRQLIDSGAFAGLRSSNLLWSDSLGVAIEKPTAFEWSAGNFGELDEISIADLVMMRWMTDMIAHGFAGDTAKIGARFFGVRLDRPTRVTLGADTKLDSTPIGLNPFRDINYAIGWVRIAYDDISKVPTDSILEFRRYAINTLDSILRKDIPSERKIFSGVFIARIRQENIPNAVFYSWLKRPLIDDALAMVRVSTRTPTFLVVDRDRGTLIYSDALRLENVLIDGKPAKFVTLNRAGYAIEHGSSVHLVMLQYLSTEPKEVLHDLERFLGSVRIRRDP